MIETLSLRNFKVFREVDVPLRPLTVIVGPNASGKSTILQALAYLVGRITSQPDVIEKVIPVGRGLAELRSYNAQGPCSVKCMSRGPKGAYEVEINISGNAPISEEKGSCIFHIGYVAPLELDPKKLAEPSPHTTSTTLGFDGRGLATVLANLKLSEARRFSDVLAQLSSVVPPIRDLRIRSVTIDSQPRFELLLDFQSAQGVPAYAASAGTLAVLGLLTTLSAPNAPRLFLLEDLERGLHPRALRELVGQLRLIQKQVEGLQIVATSHSPYLLDSFAAEEILLTSLDDNGHGQVRCLVDHPDYERWKDLMAPGEFWSSVGESWPTRDKKATAA